MSVIAIMHGADFKSVSDEHSPSFKGPFLGLNDRRGAADGCAEAKAWQRNDLCDAAVDVKKGNVNSKAHADGVHASTLGKNERPVKGLTTEKTATTLSSIGCNLGTGQNPPPGHDPSFSGHDAHLSQTRGPNRWGCPWSDVKANLHDVAVSGVVFLALNTDLAQIFGSIPRADL